MVANSQTTPSVSRIPAVLELVNKGFSKCELVRHLAPLTIATLVKNLPVRDRVHRYSDKFAYIETGLTIGAEKPRTSFRKGELGFMTTNGSICVFLCDAVSAAMNPIGTILSNVELIESSQAGDVMMLRKSE